MAQFARPSSTVSQGGWTAVNDTTHHECTDEVTPNNDTDYVEADSSDTTLELGLSSVSDPNIHTGHILRLTMESVGGSGAPEKLDIDLYQGGTLIANAFVNEQLNRGSYNTHTYTLSEAEASNISNYGDLRVRIAVDSLGGSETIRVTQVELEVPDLAGFTQTAFRFREDDSSTLNANGSTDWLATENVNVSLPIELEFRLRIEVESSGALTDGFQLRYSKDGGSYQLANNESDPFDESTGGNKFEVSCIPSAQYADLDATTDLLTTATGTFVAGDGNEDNTTGSVTFTSGDHTEHEFTILIRKLARNGANSANVHVPDGTTFDFRLYKDDGTALTGGYNNTPRVTIENRRGHIGGTWVETTQRNWIVDKSGNLYYLSEYCDLPASGAAPVMMKSTDGGKSWNAIDEGNAPTLTDLEAGDMAYESGADTIHIAIQGPSSDSVYYWTFRTADHSTNPDTWNINETVDSASTPSDQVANLEWRDDGTIVLFYADNDGNERIRYRIRSSGGTWGGENTLDTEASTNISGCKIVKDSSDTLHIFYHAWNGSAGEIWYNTLSSADSLGTRDQVDQTAPINIDGGSRVNNVLRPRIWEDAGTTYLGVGYHEDGGTDDVYWNETDITSIDWTVNEQTALSSVDTNVIGGAAVAADCAVDDVNEIIWVWGIDASDSDPKYDKRVSGSWEGDTDYLQTTDKQQRIEVFTHSASNGGNTVLGFIRHDKNGHTFNVGAGGTGFAGYEEIIIDGIDFANLGESIGGTPDNPDINDGTDGTSFSNSSWTPPTDGIILAFIQARRADTTPETPSISGNGLTWVQIGSTLDCDGGGNGLSLFAADLADATTGTITVTFTTTHVHCVVNFLQVFNDIDISGGVSNAFVQNQTNTGTGTSGSVTLSAGSHTQNRPTAAFWHLVEETSEPGTWFIKSDDQTGAGQARGVLSEYRNDVFDTSVDATWDTSANWGGFAVELKYAAAGASLTRSVADTVGITDSLSKVGTFFRSASDPVGITDVISTAINYIISLADPVGITDAISTAINFIVSLSDSVGITDTVNRILGKVVTLADTVGITDVLSTALAKVVNLSEAVGITDTLTNLRNLARSLSDPVSITDSLTKVGTFFRSFTESVGITDVLTASLKLFLSLADSVGITDTVSNARGLARSLTESVGITDTLTKVGTFIKSLSDPVGIADSLVRSAGKVISLSDSVGITDVINTVVKIVVSLSDTIGIADTLTKVGTFARSVSDSVGITDIIQTARNLKISIDEAVGIVDSVQTARQIIITFADTVGITDLIDAVKNPGGQAKFVNLEDAVGITDVLSTSVSLFRSFTDSVGITDSLITSLAKVISISNTVGITDVISSVVKISINISESISITDTITNLRNIRRNLIESISVSDSLTFVGTYLRSITESISITDTLSRSLNKIISLADSISISDSLGVVVKISISLSDSIGITDLISTARQLKINLTESINISDTLNRIGTFIRSLTESVNITDTLTRVGAYFRSISNSISIADTIQAITDIPSAIIDRINIIGSRAIRFSISASRKIRETIIGDSEQN